MPFSCPENLKAYCNLTENRDPLPIEYWNAACEFTLEQIAIKKKQINETNHES